MVMPVTGNHFKMISIPCYNVEWGRRALSQSQTNAAGDTWYLVTLVRLPEDL